MNRPNLLPTTLPRARSPLNRSALRRGSLLITLALVYFGFPHAIRAVTPAPDGGYSGNNTAEGDGALNSLGTSINNTAIGFGALFSLTNGYGNTAMGYAAQYATVEGSYNTAIGEFTLYNNTFGADNVAVGFEALYNTTQPATLTRP